jgi:hypothetical protein
VAFVQGNLNVSERDAVYSRMVNAAAQLQWRRAKAQVIQANNRLIGVLAVAARTIPPTLVQVVVKNEVPVWLSCVFGPVTQWAILACVVRVSAEGGSSVSNTTQGSQCLHALLLFEALRASHSTKKP